MFRIRKQKLILAICAVSGVILIGTFVPFLKNIYLFSLKGPLVLFSFAKKELNAVVFFHRNAAQNEALRKENDLLKAKLNSAGELALENDRLRDLLEVKRQIQWRTVAALVIGRFPENWSSVVLINKGRLSGVRKGAVVISRLGLVGRVLESSDSMAKVLLINDPNFSVSVLIQRSRDEGLVSGTLGSSLIMKYLPAEADVEPNDLVVTSGLTDICPKGLIVGTVVRAGRESFAPGKYAVVKPAVDLSAIEEVLVIAE